MNNDHIFRIENPGGIGLYRVSGYVEWLFSNNDGESITSYHGDHTDRRPTPTHDPMLMKDEIPHPHFGFKNLKQLENWVGFQALNKISKYPKLKDSEYYHMAVYVYEGHENDIVHGEKQSIMAKHNCKLIEVIQGHNIRKHRQYGESGFCRGTVEREIS